MADMAFEKDWAEAEAMRLRLFEYLDGDDLRDLRAEFELNGYGDNFRNGLAWARPGPAQAMFYLFDRLFEDELDDYGVVARWRRVYHGLPREWVDVEEFWMSKV